VQCKKRYIFNSSLGRVYGRTRPKRQLKMQAQAMGAKAKCQIDL
jgi:hypothetical protein